MMATIVSRRVRARDARNNPWFTRSRGLLAAVMVSGALLVGTGTQAAETATPPTPTTTANAPVEIKLPPLVPPGTQNGPYLAVSVPVPDPEVKCFAVASPFGITGWSCVPVCVEPSPASAASTAVPTATPAPITPTTK